MEFELKYLGEDDWSRSVYQDQNGKLWKDISCGMATPAYHDSIGNDFRGEPCDPMDILYPNSTVTLLETGTADLKQKDNDQY